MERKNAEKSLDDYFHSANFEYFESGTYSLRTIAEEDEEELRKELEEEEKSKRKTTRMERKISSEGEEVFYLNFGLAICLKDLSQGSERALKNLKFQSQFFFSALQLF